MLSISPPPLISDPDSSPHWQEWIVGSAVHPAIVAANVESLCGQEALEALLYAVIPDHGHNRHYLTTTAAKLFDKYEHITQGGWAVTGVDPLNGWQRMQWLQFKPDHPRPDPEKPGRFIKYETPPKTESRALLLQPHFLSSCKIALNYGTPEAKEAWIQRLCTLIQQFPSTTEVAALQAACERRQYREVARLFQSVSDSSKPDPSQFGHLHSGGIAAIGWAVDEGFWCWVYEHNLPILITEGAKKAGCLLSLGYAAIALPGITMGVRTRQNGVPCTPYLIPDLKFFATPGRTFYICFDHETKPQTIEAVEREIEKLKFQLSKAGCSIQIVTLLGPQKGVDDFVVAQGTQAFHSAYEAALSFEHWQTRRYSRLTYPADLELNQPYLGSLPIPDDAKFVCLKSPKGTGKTESFVEIVAAATRIGQPTLLITHRVQLAQAICDRVGLPFITEVRSSETGSLLGYGLCIDSLHPESQARFNAEAWSEALVIIDECEQVFWHALSATTEVSNHRIPILESLKKLLMGVLESDRGRIILSDADLSNLSIEFVQGLVESKVEPWVVVNRWQPMAPWSVHHYLNKTPDQWLAALDTHIAEGGKPFIVTQSQRTKSRWSTSTLETVLKNRYPNKCILRIDSETIADPTHPAYLCTAHLNGLLTQYDIVIASPSIETGVSIDIKHHFTSVWGCLSGVTPENSARQSLARVREPVDRHIWIAPHGIGRVGNGSASVKSLLSAEYQLAKITTKLVQLINFNEEMLMAYSAALKTWAKMAARINAGLIHYRESVLAGLREEGHSIIDVVDIGDNTTLLQAVEEVRDRQYQAECEAIATAEDITQNQYEELKSKKTKTRDDAHKQRKHAIQQRYQIEVTPQLVQKDDDGWHPQLKLYYCLTIGRQFLQERDRQSLEHVSQTSGFWLPTLNRSQLSTKVHQLEFLGIKTLLDPDAEFNGGTKSLDYQNAHPYLLKLRTLALQYAWGIKTVLGVTVAETMSPIQIAQTLLGKLGMKLICDRQEGGAGERQRVYRYSPPKDGRDAILTGWFTRDEASRSHSELHTPGISRQIPVRVGGAA